MTTTFPAIPPVKIIAGEPLRTDDTTPLGRLERRRVRKHYPTRRMPTVTGRYGDVVEEEGWVAIQPNLKRKGDYSDHRRDTVKNRSTAAAATTVGHAIDERSDDILFPTFRKNNHSGKLGPGVASAGLDALMQSQYFATTVDDGHTPGTAGGDVSLLSMHPAGEGGAGDALDDLFGDDGCGCGYLHDDEPSEPSSPSLSLESSIIEELETSVSKGDSAEIAVAFASLARKSTEKGQPTIISMRLVPISKVARGGLAMSSPQHARSKEVYSRLSVVGPIDLADPQEVASAMSTSSRSAYLVTECHPGPDVLDDFASLDKETQSDLLWDWSVFRDDRAEDPTDTNGTQRSVGSKSKQAAQPKEFLLRCDRGLA